MPAPLDSLLTDSDPLGHGLADPAPADDRLTALSTALATQVVESERRSKGRRLGQLRRHRWAAAAVAALVVVPTSAYAASHFFAQTGTFGAPTVNPDFEDSSEFINLCASDVTDFTRSLAPRDIPTAPNRSWDDYATAEVRSYLQDAGCGGATHTVTVQASELRRGILSRADADWGCELVWADRDGDRDAFERARASLLDLGAEARRHPAVDGDAPQIGDPDAFLAVSRLPQWVGCQR